MVSYTVKDMVTLSVSWVLIGETLMMMVFVERVGSISLYVVTLVSLDPVVQRMSDDQACLPSTLFLILEIAFYTIIYTNDTLNFTIYSVSNRCETDLSRPTEAPTLDGPTTSGSYRSHHAHSMDTWWPRGDTRSYCVCRLSHIEQRCASLSVACFPLISHTR